METGTLDKDIQLMDGATVWKWKATHGLPIDITLEEMWNRKFMPIWDKLLKAAHKDGANIERLIAELNTFATHIYPEHIWKHIHTHLKVELLDARTD